METPNDDFRPVCLPRPPQRHLRLLVVVPVVVLAWVAFTMYHNPQENRWQQKLDAFRAGENATSVLGWSPHMSDVMIVRDKVLHSMIARRPWKLSSAQEDLLIGCLNGATDERSQSEALDAYSLAARAGYLSPAQADRAIMACLKLLDRMPPPMVRLEGARFLGSAKASRGIPALQRLQSDPLPKVRVAARQGLAQIEEKK